MRERPDPIVIFHSAEDGCWLAHSLDTDQLGDGESVLQALENLMRGLESLHKACDEDATITRWRSAPQEIRDIYEIAKPLPGEIFEIACKRVHGKWPASLSVDVDPDTGEGPYSAVRSSDELTPA